MFKRHVEHKTRPKLLTSLLTMLICLSMIIPLFSIQTMDVHATDVGGKDGKFTGKKTSDGVAPSWNKSGWLFYVCNSSGQLITDVVYVQGTDRAWDSSYDEVYLTSRVGTQQPSRFLPPFPFGAPLTDNGSNWEVMKADTSINGLNYVAAVFGSDVANQVKTDDQSVHVILEVVAWGKRPGKSAGDNAVASASGWARMTADGLCVPNSDFSWQYLNKIQKSEYLEFQWAGLDPPPTVFPPDDVTSLPTDLMLANAYGMARLGAEGAPQTTADEPLIPTPHDPPDESTGIKTIVKNYRTYNETTGVYTDDGKTHRDNVAPDITIEEEGEYKVVGWRTSTGSPNYSIDSRKWHETPTPQVIQSGTTSGHAILGTTERVLYVLLEKPENEIPVTGTADFIISQSTITRKIKLSYPDNAGINIMMNVDFRWERDAHKYTCSGHSYHGTHNADGSCGSGCGSASCTYGEFTDNHTKLALNNADKDSYPDILATKSGWEAVTTTGLDAYVKKYKEHSSGHIKTEDYWNNDFNGKWDYACVLLRGKDKLTVARWKNDDLGKSAANTDLANVSSSGFSIGNNATGSRKKALYYDKFKVTIEDDSPDLTTKYSTTAGNGHGSNCGENSRTFSLVTDYSADVGVKVETYSGSPNEGVDDPSCNSTPTEHGVFSGLPVLSGLTNVKGIEVHSGGTISFRPYIQMNYDLVTATHANYGADNPNHKTAYVIGDIVRSLTPNDYAEVSWKDRASNKPNLTLNSLQWSTHSSAVDFIGNKLGASNVQKFNVLPGGATLDLTIKEADRQKMQVTTYQCIIEGSGKTQITNTGGSDGGLTSAQADSAHSAYVDSVINALDKLNVEQWIINDLGSVNGGNIESSSTDVWNLGGSPLTNGENLSKAGHPDQTASMEYKYYFQNDGTFPDAPAAEGDLDVEKKGTTSKKYTFFTNTYGEIRYIEGNTSPNIGNEKMGTLANDAIANQINQRTHVIDKLEAALERGTGNDTSGRSKTTEQWYNEAFDGITVYVQSTELSIGYIEPPQRTTVLDPKVTQTQKDQSDMFNKDKYNMSQYRTKEYSAAYDVTDMVGEFKGTKVYMKDMKMLFFSKKFFIGNVTVDDLH